MSRSIAVELAIKARITNVTAEKLEEFYALCVMHAMQNLWAPIETAKKDTFLTLAGPSGYTTTPCVIATGIMYSDSYRPGRWLDHSDAALTDWGFEPTHWTLLPFPNEYQKKG